MGSLRGEQCRSRGSNILIALHRRFVGRDETGTRMEIVELAPELEHPFFIGSQFHPEVGAMSRLVSDVGSSMQ